MEHVFFSLRPAILCQNQPCKPPWPLSASKFLDSAQLRLQSQQMNADADTWISRAS
jgi:hypothetical protein